ncbi:MAG: hypothetical protein D6755_02390 [Anaerolineae bacterium]|nr:MAG: hypothetical protein D6755_02390 [Anaerolineae bacterium]
MTTPEAQLIVDMVARGTLKPEEAESLLQAVEGATDSLPGDAESQEAAPLQGESASPPWADEFPNFQRYRHLWVWPFALMGFLTLVTGGWLGLLLFAHSGPFWLTCAWMGVAFSLGGLLLTWLSRSAHWLYLRVEPEGDDWPRKLVFIFPLPLGILTWVLGWIPHWIDELPISAADWRQLGREIKEHLTPETPLYIQVDDGDRVEIFIG